MGRSPALATVLLALAVGTPLVEGRGQVTPACVDGNCDEPRDGQSILQVKSLDRSELPGGRIEEGADSSQGKPHRAALKMQGAAGSGGKKRPIKGKILLQTDKNALTRGGPVEEDMREDLKPRVPDTLAMRQEAKRRAEEIGIQENRKAGNKGRKPAKANSLVQMSNKKSQAQLQEEEDADEDAFSRHLHISVDEEKHIMGLIAVAKEKKSEGLRMSHDLIKDMVRHAALLQETVLRQRNITGNDDAAHGKSGQDMLDAIAAEAEDTLTEEEQKATEEAASHERLLPPAPNASSLLQKKSSPAKVRIQSEGPQRPSTDGKDFYDWVAEHEEAEMKPAARKGVAMKPAKGKSLVQMANTKSKAQLHEEDEEEEEEGSASNLGIGVEEEQQIFANIARAKAIGDIHPRKELSAEAIKEILKSVALFQQLTPSAQKSGVDPEADGISGTEDAAHGHSSQDMLDEIAASEEEKLSEAEQKASEEAAQEERLLPPEQSLMQKKSQPAMARKILTEDPQRPTTNGKDFYDWVAEQEEAAGRPKAKKGDTRKPAKGKSLVQMTNKKTKVQLHEEDKAHVEDKRSTSNLGIGLEEEQQIAANIARAKADGMFHPSKDLSAERIKELVKSATLFQQLTPSASKAQGSRVDPEADGISGTEDAAHGHSSQDMLDEIAAAEEDKLSEAEQKASEEAAQEERLLPPEQSLMQKKSEPAMARKILTEDPQRPSTNGKDFYDWVSEQEEAETRSVASKAQRMTKPAKGSSLVQMGNTKQKTKLREEDEAHTEDADEEEEEDKFASNLHISMDEEMEIMLRIARAKADGIIHPSKEMTPENIKEVLKSVALLRQVTPSLTQQSRTDPEADGISGTEDAAHGHSSQDMLEEIAAAEEEKLSEAEQKASEEAAQEERLLPPEQSLMQKKSEPAKIKILTEDPQRPSTNGRDFYDWVAEQEASEGQRRRPRGGMR